MIITREYGKKLVGRSKAIIIGMTCTGNYWPAGDHYVIINRIDIKRTDHYLAKYPDDYKQPCMVFVLVRFQDRAMLNLILILLITLNATHDKSNEMIINAYKDYNTTISNVNTIFEKDNVFYIRAEVNPVTRYIFDYVEYDRESMEIIGVIYLVLINTLNYLPYSQLTTKLISITHFYFAYTWNSAPIQTYPETIYIKFNVSF